MTGLNKSAEDHIANSNKLRHELGELKDRETDYKLKNYDIMHAFGHSLGLDIHEAPILRSTQDYILKENTVLAIEPGVYFPGRYGMRIEDTFLVGKNECINLTKSSKDYTIIKLK